ncbi:hypothetical protein KCA24_26605, partial [Escherichia coli]|nr:hypothetical protein [Escherichia coli]
MFWGEDQADEQPAEIPGCHRINPPPRRDLPPHRAPPEGCTPPSPPPPTYPPPNICNTLSSTTPVIYALGNEHSVCQYFTKTSDNTWEVQYTFDGQQQTGVPATTLTFDP